MDHDDLLRWLRERAYDPARRLDEVSIPLADLAGTTAPELEELRGLYTPALAKGARFTTVPGGSPEAVAFYRGAPLGPAVPPIPIGDLTQREQAAGVQLPQLLRRLYTEVGDGGFGPGYGILGIGECGHGDDYHQTAWDLYRTWVSAGRALDRFGWPICYHGCARYSFVSLSESGNPVRLWDPNALTPADPPEAGLLLTVPSLEEWLEDWLAGRDRLAELIDEA